jgi:glutathione synthase/RimK-type ligase-like ATP-grasp enzyme
MRAGMTLPDPARYAIDAAQAIGADYADLDEGGGYLFRVSKGGKSVVLGAGGVCAFPINSATAYTLSRDKAHTKSALKEAGLPVIPGGIFFAHKRRAGLRGPGREIEDARAFATRLGYPVFAKPNQGSRGNFAEIVADDAALSDYIGRVAVEFESFLVEPVISGAEHRVLIHDSRPVFHTMKHAPTLIGDGSSTMSGLLDALNEQLVGGGISPYPESVLVLTGRNAASVPGPVERIPLPGRRNLSADGEIESFSPDAPQSLALLAGKAVTALGLRVGAVDMFDVSAAGDLSDMLVIEVNGNPGLKTLELAGRSDLIRAIWTSMLDESLR